MSAKSKKRLQINMTEQNLSLTDRAKELRKRGEEIAKLPVMARMAAAQSMGEDVAALLVDMAAATEQLGRALVKTCEFMEKLPELLEVQERRISELEALVSADHGGEAGE